MLEVYFYAIVSVIIVSLIAVIMAIPFFLKKKISNDVLLILLCVAVGVILATVFFEFLPEVYGGHEHTHSYEEHTHSHEEHTHSHEEHGHSINLGKKDEQGHSHDDENKFFIVSIYLLMGFLMMFVVEKLVHFHHSKNIEKDCLGHSHAYSLAPVNLIGDGVHNFIDGLIIAGTYFVSIPLGIVTTISIAFHEIPQELANFGILLYSGYSKMKALVFNFIFATTAILGTLIGLFLAGNVGFFNEFIIPFAAGNFIYIAASNLVPQLHRHCKLKESLIHLVAIIIGVLIIVGVLIIFPHSH